MISPMPRSATSSLSTSGVLVTATPRARQAARSMASVPTPRTHDLEARQLRQELRVDAPAAVGDDGADRRGAAAEQARLVLGLIVAVQRIGAGSSSCIWSGRSGETTSTSGRITGPPSGGRERAAAWRHRCPADQSGKRQPRTRLPPVAVSEPTAAQAAAALPLPRFGFGAGGAGRRAACGRARSSSPAPAASARSSARPSVVGFSPQRARYASGVMP